MKTLKERFHKEIVRKYKENYFSTARKELQQQQEFLLFYEHIIDSGDDLISLLHHWGYATFFKYVNQILDHRLYQKLYHQNPKYFLQNLNFLHYLLQLEVLPVQHVGILVSALGEVIQLHQRISSQNATEIFHIVQKILTSPKYTQCSIQAISNHSLLPKLYSIIIQKEANEYFFKLIRFCKLIGNESMSKISDQQKLHCLQIHILTSSSIEQLYISYSTLGDIFGRCHSVNQQLYEYGSILDKTMKDIVIGRLLDPICHFLARALNNQSLKKLSIEMGYVDVIFDVILNHLMIVNNLSLFSHQSIWSIFTNLIMTLKQNKLTKLLAGLDWTKFSQRLSQYKPINRPELKTQVNSTLLQLSTTNEPSIILSLLSPPQQQLLQQFQQVQI